MKSEKAKTVLPKPPIIFEVFVFAVFSWDVILENNDGRLYKPFYNVKVPLFKERVQNKN
jgi:hypothetical protein